MKKPIFTILAVTLAFVASVSMRHGRTAAELPHGNKKIAHALAPEFSLTDLSGQRLDLAAYRGKVVLLDFWATWCARCRSEIPGFIALHNKYRDRGLRIIRVSLDDDVRPVRTFYEQLKMNTRSLSAMPPLPSVTEGFSGCRTLSSSGVMAGSMSSTRAEAASPISSRKSDRCWNKGPAHSRRTKRCGSLKPTGHTSRDAIALRETKKTTVSWAALLDEPVSKSGYVHEAYSRFHN